MPEVATSQAGWNTVAFGHVIRQVKDKVDPEECGAKRYVGGEHMDTDDLRIRRWGEIGDGYLGPAFHMRFKPGHVLYGSRRTYLRKVALADFEGITANTTYVLESQDPNVLLPELVPFIMQTESFHAHSKRESKGSVNPYVNFSDLAWYEFALPPLEEQRRIAEVLQTMEAMIVAQQTARRLAWRANLANYTAATKDVDSRWELASIGEALLLENRLRKPLSSAVRSEIQGEFPYYGATGQLDSISEYRLDGTYALIGEDGDHFLKYNKQSMTQLISGRFNVNNHAHVIKGSDKCLTEWFYHYYRYRDVRPWLAKQGSGRLKLKKSTLESMPISLPPIDEQRKIIERLEGTADAVDTIEERIRSSRVLRRQLVQTCLGEA